MTSGPTERPEPTCGDETAVAAQRAVRPRL
ncbi:hypothetical protein BX265_5689 [Streptomyces sp. TLI_235]|nr:hypothetical protein BX265_5689 [Streptomyces sp. TLI_235]